MYPLAAFKPEPAASVSSYPSTGEYSPTRIGSEEDLEKYGLASWAKLNILYGDDVAQLNALHREIGGPASTEPYPSRSEPLFAATCEMVRRSVPNGIILGVLLDPRFGISASVRDKGRTMERYARKQVASAHAKVSMEVVGAPQWPDVQPQTGAPKASLRNAKLAIRALGITCEHDTFHNRFVLGGHALEALGTELTDNACVVLRNIILEHFNFDPKKEHVLDAALSLCLENQRDPPSVSTSPG